MGRRHLPIAAIVSGLFSAGAAAASGLPYPIVGTGQTTCFDNAYEIACPQPGQPFYGQDAQFPGRRPSYTLSRDGLSVADNNTGLIWQHSPETNNDGVLDRRDKLTLSQARKRPAELNAIRFGGYNDWRLPTIKELDALVDLERFSPAIDPVFAATTVPSSYWSSTTDANGSVDAWLVKFGDGSDNTVKKYSDYYVRAVRGGQ